MTSFAERSRIRSFIWSFLTPLHPHAVVITNRELIKENMVPDLRYAYMKIPKTKDWVVFCPNEEGVTALRNVLSDVQVSSYIFENKVMERNCGPEVHVGNHYQFSWKDGGIGQYEVLALNERDYSIRWTNGAEITIQYTSRIHKDSVQYFPEISNL